MAKKNAYPGSIVDNSLLYMLKTENGWDIFKASLTDGEAARLTDNNFEDGLPVFSPDGTAIAYLSNESDDWAIWTMTPDGENKNRWFGVDVKDGFVDVEQWKNQRMGWRPHSLP